MILPMALKELSFNHDDREKKGADKEGGGVCEGVRSFDILVLF